MSTRVLTGSRAGIGSVVVTETSSNTANVAGVGVINEAPGSGGGGGGAQTVRVIVLA